MRARLRHRGRAAGHRRRHPQRRGPARERAGRPGADPQRRRAVRARPRGADRSRTPTPAPTSRCTSPRSTTRAPSAACRPTPDGRVTAFLEKTPEPVTDRINAGCYVFRRAVIDAIPAGRVVSVERETFPGLLADGAVVLGHLDTGVLAGPRHARGLRAGLARPGARACWRRPPCPARSGEALVLDGAGRRRRGASRGGTTSARGASSAPVRAVDGSVLLDGAVVEAGAVVRDSVVGARRARRGRDGARRGGRRRRRRRRRGQRAAPGARVWTDARIPPYAIRFSPDERQGDRSRASPGSGRRHPLVRRRSAQASRWPGSPR